MTSDNEQILQDYIERLLLLQDEHDDWLDEEQLEATARDLGLSDEDLVRLDARIEAHRQRGLHFSENNAWNDAIHELRQAAVLDPFNVALLQALASAHVSRWEGTHENDDRDAAERYARRCIELDPNHKPSFDLLETLRPLAESGGKRTRSRLLWVTLAAAVGMAGFLVLQRPSDTDVGSPSPESAERAEALAPDPTKREVPVQLGIASEMRGLTIDVQQSLLSPYDSAFSYNLDATVTSETEELHQLRLRASMMGSDGEEIQSVVWDVQGDWEPYLRPGESAPISGLVYEERSMPDVDHVQLSIDIVQLEPAAPSYDAPIPLELQWPSDQPEHLEFEVGERESNVVELIGAERTHRITLATHNRGSRSLHELVVEVAWLDSADEVITTERIYLVESGGPPMRSGETRIGQVFGTFPDGEAPPFARYTVSVIAAQ